MEEPYRDPAETAERLNTFLDGREPTSFIETNEGTVAIYPRTVVGGREVEAKVELIPKSDAKRRIEEAMRPQSSFFTASQEDFNASRWREQYYRRAGVMGPPPGPVPQMMGPPQMPFQASGSMNWSRRATPLLDAAQPRAATQANTRPTKYPTVIPTARLMEPPPSPHQE